MPRRTSPTELLAWSLVGASAGAVLGFALAEWFGPVDPRRLLARPAPAPDRPASALVRDARQLLAAEPELAELGLEPILVGRGVLELHGWVPTRALRTRAARVLGRLANLDSLVNCLLVHGEDDPGLPEDDLTGQTA